MASAGAAATGDTAQLTLDDLEAMTRTELDELFDGAATPSVEELDGEYRGRVLSGPVFPLDNSDLATTVTMALVNNPTNPWRGKTFTPLGTDHGEGVNLLGLGPFESEVLDFDYRVAPATYGDDDCVFLDYDRPENPRGARRIRDELKRVDDGLYLGRLYLEGGDGMHFVLYWALAE